MRSLAREVECRFDKGTGSVGIVPYVAIFPLIWPLLERWKDGKMGRGGERERGRRLKAPLNHSHIWGRERG